MKNSMSHSLLVLVFALAGLTAAMAQASAVIVRVDQNAFVRVDGSLKGIASAVLPLNVPVPPGRHRVLVEAVLGNGRFEQEVEVDPGISVPLDVKLATNNASPYTHSAQAPAADRERERLERQQKVRQLDLQLDSLQRQKAEYEDLRSKAERHLQQYCQQGGNVPNWLVGLSVAGCLAAQANRDRAETQIRRLETEIESKRREIQRIERQDLF